MEQSKVEVFPYWNIVKGQKVDLALGENQVRDFWKNLFSYLIHG